MDEQLKKQIEEFREKTEKFSKGEINVAEYKSFFRKVWQLCTERS